jgi:DNA mismatch repair protein MutS2
MSVTGQPTETIDEISRDLETVEAKVDDRKKRRKQETPERSVSYSIGEEVFLSTIESFGVITSIDDTQAEVQVGRLRVRAQLDEISRKKPAGDTGGKPEKDSQEPSGARPTVAPPPLELDLRGTTVDEAVELLERRLDSAYLNGMPYMRVIHGKGTGRLREAIRTYLEANAYVETFEPGGRSEGGDGVTVVRIKQ